MGTQSAKTNGGSTIFTWHPFLLLFLRYVFCFRLCFCIAFAFPVVANDYGDSWGKTNVGIWILQILNPPGTCDVPY